MELKEILYNKTKKIYSSKKQSLRQSIKEATCWLSKFKILNMLKILYQQLKLPALSLEVQNYSPFNKVSFPVIKYIQKIKKLKEY